MIVGHKIRWVTFGLVALISWLSGYYAFFMNPPRVLIANDGAAGWEARMQPVRDRLPATVREVGYLSDNQSSALIQEYSLTRFALAPIVVRPGTNYEWIIGNFTEKGFETIIRSQINGEYQIEKFGSGIYLIHRSTP